MAWSFTFKPVCSLKKYSTHNPGRRSSIAKSLHLDMVKSLEFCPISKRDESERIVRAVILKPGFKHSSKEIASTCYKWMEGKDKGGVNGAVKILESMIVPTDMKINGRELKKSTWIMVLKILDDSLWRDFQSGAFKIAGENVQRI